MAKKKTFKFKDPNTGEVKEYPDNSYWRGITKKRQEKYDKLTPEQKKRIKDRQDKLKERKAKQDKLRTEVREGKEAGLSMHEIRAKRLNMTPEELTKKNLATLLGMAEGMSMFLPAGAAIKAGQLVYRGMKGAKAAKALKAAAAANRSTKGGKQSGRVTVSDKQKSSGGRTTVIPKPRSTSGPSTRGSRRPKKKDEVIEGTAVEKSAKPAKRVDGKDADKKPGTAVTTRSRTDVKKPGTGVMEVRRAATGPRTMKRVQGSDKPTPKPRVTTKPKKKPNASANSQRRTADALLGGLAGAGVLAVANKAISPTKPKAETTPKRRASPGGVNKGKDPKKTKPRTSGPATRGSVAPKKVTPRTSGPATRGSNKRGATARITAGPNTGFGPKGNIFPSNAAERAALMKMYGGTGSAAAKAAAAGKQGNLTAGKAAYEKAKKDRLKKKK